MNDFILTERKKGGLYFSLLISLYCIVVFIGQVIMSLLTTPNTFGYFALAYAFPLLALFITLLVYDKKNKSRKLFRFETKNLKIYAPLSIVIALSLFFGLGFVNGVIVNFLSKLGVTVSTTELTVNDAGEYIYFVIVVAIFPALFEELFFRKLLIDNFIGAGKLFAVLFSGVLFALYHVSLAQLVYQLVYGAVLGLLYIKSKNILPCVIAHFTNNFLILTFTFFGVMIDLNSLAFILTGIAVLALSIIFLSLYKKEEKSIAIKGEKTHAVTYSLFGVLICLTLILSSLFM